MKKQMMVWAGLILCLSLEGCSTLAGWDSWKSAHAGKRGIVRVAQVKVDRIGERESVVHELQDMAPLYLLDRGFAVREDSFDYVAEIRAREREYGVGWDMKRSLTLEVCIWPGMEDPGNSLPLAAGRVAIRGDQTLASSETLTYMLRTALRRAVWQLPGKPEHPVNRGADSIPRDKEWL